MSVNQAVINEIQTEIEKFEKEKEEVEKKMIEVEKEKREIEKEKNDNKEKMNAAEARVKLLEEKGDEANLPSATNLLATWVSVLASKEALLLEIHKRIVELEGRLKTLTNQIVKNRDLIHNYQLDATIISANNTYERNDKPKDIEAAKGRKLENYVNKVRQDDS